MTSEKETDTPPETSHRPPNPESRLEEGRPEAKPQALVAAATTKPEIINTWRDLRGIWRVFIMSEWILRDREGFFAEVKARTDLNTKLRNMILSSLFYLALYGAAMGIPNGWEQAISSTIKLPLLFLLTLLICLPTLYFFNLLYGSQLTFQQTVALIMAAVTITAVVTLSFTSIVLFFWISAPDQYTLLILLNTSVLAISSWWGLAFLRQGMHYVQQGAPQVRQGPILTIWLLIYAFVGTQMAWTLRPFFGVPGEPFVILRGGEGTFYESLATTLFWLVGRLFDR